MGCDSKLFATQVDLQGHAFGQGRYPQRPVTVAREEWPALLLTAVAAIGLGLGGMPVWNLLGGGS